MLISFGGVGVGGRKIGGGGWGVVRFGNVLVKNNANRFLFQQKAKYLISVPFHRLESAIHYCQKKA